MIYDEYNQYDITEQVGSDETLLDNIEKPMGFSKAKVINLLWTICLSVVVAGGGYILGVGDLWSINVKVLTNVAVLTAFSTIITSIKLIGTNEDTGEFLGTKVR